MRFLENQIMQENYLASFERCDGSVVVMGVYEKTYLFIYFLRFINSFICLFYEMLQSNYISDTLGGKDESDTGLVE